MAAVLRQSAVPDPVVSHPLTTARAVNQRPPLFCMNYSGSLASKLDDVPVYSLGSYFDDLRDCGSIEKIARVNIERMRGHQKEGPYQLTGFCGMALVAFEMARHLHQQGQEVSLLALIDPPSVGPHCTASSIPRYYAVRLLYHLSRLATVHPKLWPNYCRMRLITIWHRIFARSLEIANRPDRLELDALYRMERAIRTYAPGSIRGE